MAEPQPPRVRAVSEVPIALTLGDPSGIGPEVVRHALADPVIRRGCFRIFGDLAALQAAAGPPLPRREPWLELVDCPEPTGGEALARATDELIAGRAAALVTGPIEKARVAQVLGADFIGQTEYLAGRWGVSGQEVMMLAGSRLRVALLTTHLPLREVAERITSDHTLRVLRTVHRALPRLFGVIEPRIGLAALNPHAGEQGLFGDEEERLLAPAVRQAQAEGIRVSGPLAADSLFYRAVQGEFDAVVACYHDQGLAPLKLVAFHDAVNITLGLPRLRVSPDHGTARELVGRQLAHPGSMIQALRLAMRQTEQLEESTDETGT